MLTAHLPSGYVLARSTDPGIRWLMPAALIGAVLPDLDMLFFHFVDGGRIHHHRYWVHVPAFWVAIATVSLAVLARTRWFATGIVFFAAIFLHMLLDTISGGIMWAAPFNDHLYTLVTVPPTQDHWIASFLLHWTFLLEVMIWGLAFYLWRREQPS